MTSRTMPVLAADVEKKRAATLAQPPSITVERFCTEAAWTDLREEWESLQMETASPNPFLTWGWISVWWSQFGKGRRLEILAIRKEGELIGIAPFYREALRLIGIPFGRLSLLGDEGVGSDHLDLISRNGLEETVAVAVARFLREERRDWDFVHFRGFAEASPSLAVFAGELGEGWVIQSKEEEVCPYLPLDPTWDAYLNRLSGSMRYTIRRKIKNLEKDEKVELVMLEAREPGRLGMERLIDLHQKRWNAQGGSAAFISGSKIPFHRKTSDYFFEKGIAKLFFLNVNGEAVASLYGFAMGGKFFYYQAGFDPAWGNRSVGMVLMAKSIQAAISCGWREFDFLRGPEGYKAHWTSAQRKIWKVFIYPPCFKSALYRNLLAMKQAAKKTIKGLLPEAWIKKLQAGNGEAS